MCYPSEMFFEQSEFLSNDLDFYHCDFYSSENKASRLSFLNFSDH